MLGDSRTVANRTSDATNIYSWGSSGVIGWLRRLSKQRFKVLYFGGVSGERTDQINARVPTAIASGAGTFVYWGGINDIAQNYPTSGTSGATAAANIIEAGRLILAAGGTFVVFLDYASTSGGTAAQFAQMMEMNARVNAWAISTPGVIVFDAAHIMLDYTTATAPTLRSGSTYDGTHPSMRYAYLLGKALYAQLSSMLVTSVGRRVSGLQDQFATNPFELLPNGNNMTASGGSGSGSGGVTGTIPLSVIVTRTGSAAATAISTSAAPDGGNYLIAAITGAASGDVIRLRYVPTLVNFISGENYRAMVDVDVSGTANLDSVRLCLEYEVGGSTVTLSIDGNYATGERPGVPDSETYSATLLTEAFPVPASPTAVRWYVEARFNGASGAATVQLSNASLMRIPT
jgi:hypothetical protein